MSGVIRDIVRKIDRSTGDRLVPTEADGLMESFEHAAGRHFADAEDLGRSPAAGQRGPPHLTSEFVDRAFGSFLTRADRLIVDSSG